MNEPNIIRIYSFGGVGSKQLFNGLKEFFPNPGALLHRHHRIPPTALGINNQVIYVFGNPMNAVISFFNRRIAVHERHGFASGTPRNGPRKDWAREHCRKTQGDWENFSVEWGLEDFLNIQKDLFRLEEHFDNWLQFQPQYPLLYLKYETLWRHLPELFGFLKLPSAGVAFFPPFIPRSSDWTTQPQPIQKKLLALYGNLRDQINNQPELEIR